MPKMCKLVMVAIGDKASSGASQNNKFYNMTDTEDGNFLVEYGRIGTTSQKAKMPIGKWDKVYNEKIKKGYSDVTHLFVEEEVQSVAFSEIKESEVASIVALLQAYARKEVRANYNVSAEKVTKKQLDEAQVILNSLISMTNVKEINDSLIQLFTVIPRRMSDVNHHLIHTFDQNGFNRRIANEQSLLDTMAGQVKQAELVKENTDASLTLLDALGIQMSTISTEEHDMIKAKLGDISDKFVKAFKVVNTKTQKVFDEYVGKASNKKCELLFHGSRNENWMGIIESGLLLRPTNVIISGKMFGYGTYTADKARKSYGYTSGRGSYWARGNSSDAFMALYNVYLGNSLHIKRHESWCGQLTKDNLLKRGEYDSLFAEGGADLRNNEYIVYDEAQTSIAYLIQLQG